MITIKWGKEDKTIMLYEFEGSWSIDDLIEALDSGVEVANRYDHDIDVIVDLTEAGFPDLFGTNVQKAFERAVNRTDDHMQETDKEPGLIVIVSQNQIMNNTLRSLMRMYQKMGERVAVADDIPAAERHIADFRGQQARPMTGT